ncbi:hypothetical protein CBR_g39324 [Chara braunii]|uniref:Uncharacterized protein n=1 Tax=Chara braunii TaxID=69332 RepID=A0A388K151_CHABU|nr:hypothetical protein CBR_g39324 [Chara braunii]|eukprot:GBG63780.1 hypothetical protein CBR_g39324 [Chara braunii]
MARPVKAGSSTVPANLAIFEQAVLGLCKQHPDGVPEKVLEEELPDVSVYDRAQAINSLLQKKELQILKHGNTLVYKEVDQEEAVKFKGLGQDDVLIYQIIQQAGNTGG